MLAESAQLSLSENGVEEYA